MFKILVQQTLNNLADEQLKFLIRDRYSSMRFLDVGLEGRTPPLFDCSARRWRRPA